MATVIKSRDDVDLESSRRSLVLVWQSPETRTFVKIGQIDALAGNKVAFRYLPGADRYGDRVIIDEFPRLDAVYVSNEVPAFFANRVLSPERRGYGDYLRWLGVERLDANDVPFEVLARTGGGRATDTFHVVDVPVEADGALNSRFFVSGIRHVAESGRALESVSSGSPLRLEIEGHNAHNAKAVLINTRDGRQIGWVPDWLCDEVHDRIRDGLVVTAVAERVNADAPAHLRLLAHVTAPAGR